MALQSPSSRRAWIEIDFSTEPSPTSPVALLAEGVDRNVTKPTNLSRIAESPSSRRAWIEITSRRMQGHRKESPSSRRAWIEIHTSTE